MAENMSPKTFIADVAVARHLIVKLKSGTGDTVEVTGSDEGGIGITQKDVDAGERVAVRLFNAGGTFKVVASEAIAEGAALFSAADGKVTDTDPGTGTVRYTALKSTSADLSVFEILPLSNYDA